MPTHAPAGNHYWEPRDDEWTTRELELRQELRLHWIVEFATEPSGSALLRGVRRRTRHALPSRVLATEPMATVRKVADLSDGSTILLERPAPANWGMDFVVRVAHGERKAAPRHSDLVADVRGKIEARPESARDVFEAVDHVYRCGDPDACGAMLSIGSRLPGWEPDRLLHLYYWLFLEQDVTYWASSGRRMLMEATRNAYRALFAPGTEVELPGGRFASTA